MIFKKNYLPQFREAERDGLVGLRGYMNYFQDMATHYMHNIDKGNDTLPETYGIVWMFTKYKMQVMRKVDFTEELTMETWIPKGRLTAVVRQNLLISRNGEECARGCVESCLYHVSQNRLVRLREIDFPADITEDREFSLPGFQKMPTETEGMEYAYTHQVRYTDLDKTGHMTNLKYVDLFLNAFDSPFFEEFQISDFELHFLSQCFEGEVLHVYKRISGDRVSLVALHENKAPCAAAGMTVVRANADRSVKGD
ncbi:MAG: thioesterase [Eubacteriales bacterium]|nr:thioesterase [Eubacteriales bacterium]